MRRICPFPLFICAFNPGQVNSLARRPVPRRGTLRKMTETVVRDATFLFMDRKTGERFEGAEKAAPRPVAVERPAQRLALASHKKHLKGPWGASLGIRPTRGVHHGEEFASSRGTSHPPFSCSGQAIQSSTVDQHLFSRTKAYPSFARSRLEGCSACVLGLGSMLKSTHAAKPGPRVLWRFAARCPPQVLPIGSIPSLQLGSPKSSYAYVKLEGHSSLLACTMQCQHTMRQAPWQTWPQRGLSPPRPWPRSRRSLLGCRTP